MSKLAGNTELTDRVRRLYFEEYIKVWDKYIADVRVVKLGGLEQSLQVSRALSGVDSPLAAFLRGVDRETTLVLPVAAAGANSSTAVGNAEQRADQAKREMAAVLGKVQAPKIERTGPPLEQMVDDHFAHIHRLFKGTPPPIEDVLKLFNDHRQPAPSASRPRLASRPSRSAARSKS